MNASNEAAALTPCYRAHLVRIDGTPIDTPTGTLSFSHAYFRRNGKPYTRKAVACRYAKRYPNHRVERVELFHFDPLA